MTWTTRDPGQAPPGSAHFDRRASRMPLAASRLRRRGVGVAVVSREAAPDCWLRQVSTPACLTHARQPQAAGRPFAAARLADGCCRATRGRRAAVRRPALQRGDGDDAGLASRTMDVAQALDERTRRARCAAIPHFGSAATQRRRRWADRGGEGKCMTVGMGLEAVWAGEGEGGWRGGPVGGCQEGLERKDAARARHWPADHAFADRSQRNIILPASRFPANDCIISSSRPAVPAVAACFIFRRRRPLCSSHSRQ